MTTTLHQSVRFVLVEPSHPGNIGAVARAIKTMGFGHLALVNPKKFPDDEASARASGANDILDQANVYSSLEDAIADCEFVVGTSVRDRQISWPVLSPRETATKLCNLLSTANLQQLDSQDTKATVAVLFGRERTGLENHELDHAQWQIRIPANAEYSSLNLASAAQIIAYEFNVCFSAFVAKLIENSEEESRSDDGIGEAKTGVELRQRLATHQEMQGFYQHLEATLLELDFIKTNPPTKLLRKIIRLYNRSHVTFEELQILRGMLTATQQKIAQQSE